MKAGEASQLLGQVNTIVLATGAESFNDLEPKVKAMVSEVYVMGDAARPGKMMAAVEQAADLARKL